MRTSDNQDEVSGVAAVGMIAGAQLSGKGVLAHRASRRSSLLFSRTTFVPSSTLGYLIAIWPTSPFTKAMSHENCIFR
jgi:hypothetical protein